MRGGKRKSALFSACNPGDSWLSIEEPVTWSLLPPLQLSGNLAEKDSPALKSWARLVVCGLYFILLQWVQYTALCTFPVVSCVISHFCSNVAQEADKGFKSSATQTRTILFCPVAVFATLQRQERTWLLSTWRPGQRTRPTHWFQLESKERSCNQLATPKTHSREVTSWLLDHFSSWNVSTLSKKRPRQQTEAVGEVYYTVINR